MMGNGSMDNGMVTGYKYGLIRQSMMDNGHITRLQGMEHLLIPMEMYLKAIGKMTRLMVLVYIRMQKQVQHMKDIGKMICNMDQVFKHMTEVDIKGCLRKGKNMDKALMLFQMGRFLKDNGKMVEYKEKEYAIGRMGEFIKVNG